MTTQTITTETVTEYVKPEIPTVRRTDEVRAKSENWIRFVARKINSLTRAEIGVMYLALGKHANTAAHLSAAEYLDGLDPETGNWTGRTRRLSDAAREKAIRSLVEQGLIHFEGIRPGEARSRYHSAWTIEHHVYGPGNSDVELWDDGEGGTEPEENSYSRGKITTNQVAGWLNAYYLGLTDTNPWHYFSVRDLSGVEVVATAPLRHAMRQYEDLKRLVENAQHLQWKRDQIADLVVADLVKPNPQQIYNAVGDAFYESSRETDDPGAILDAMAKALQGYYQQAHYGLIDRNAVTPDVFEDRLADYAYAVASVNAAIEEVIA